MRVLGTRKCPTQNVRKSLLFQRTLIIKLLTSKLLGCKKCWLKTKKIMVKSSLIRNVESTMWTMLLFKGWAVTILCQVFGCFFFFSFLVKTDWTFESDLHFSHRTLINTFFHWFLLCLFSLAGGWRGKRQGQRCWNQGSKGLYQGCSCSFCFHANYLSLITIEQQW